MSPSLTMPTMPGRASAKERPGSTATIPVVSFDMLAGSYRKQRADSNFNFLVSVAMILVVVIITGYGLLQQINTSNVTSQTLATSSAIGTAEVNIGKLYKVSNPQGYQAYIKSIQSQLKKLGKAEPDTAAILSGIAGAASTVPGVTLTGITIGDLGPSGGASSTATTAPSSSSGTEAPSGGTGTVTITGKAPSVEAATAWEQAVGGLTFLTGTSNTTISGTGVAGGPVTFTTPAALVPTETAPSIASLITQLNAGGQ
jgi:hypothetical protein